MFLINIFRECDISLVGSTPLSPETPCKEFQQLARERSPEGYKSAKTEAQLATSHFSWLSLGIDFE